MPHEYPVLVGTFATRNAANHRRNATPIAGKKQRLSPTAHPGPPLAVQLTTFTGGHFYRPAGTALIVAPRGQKARGNHGCDSGHAKSCFEFSDYYQGQRDLTSAFPYDKKGCDLSHIPSCLKLAFDYQMGRGVKRDLHEWSIRKSARSVINVAATGFQLEAVLTEAARRR
jgi:hypothetical protein